MTGMPQVEMPLSRAEFQERIRPLLGLRVSRPWLGHGDVLFLELGRLASERLGSRITTRGQATLLWHGEWRAEPAPRDVGAFKGEAVARVRLEGRPPRLIVDLEPARRIRGIGAPDWNVFLNDRRLFPREGACALRDHTMLLGLSERGRLRRIICHA
jgi:hypothetical protein